MKMIINYNFDFTMEGEHKDMMQQVFGDGDITFYVSDESKKRLRESIKALEYRPKQIWTLDKIRKMIDKDVDGFQQITDITAICYLRSLLPTTCDCEISEFYLRKEISPMKFPVITIRMKIGDEIYNYPGKDRPEYDRSNEKIMLKELRRQIQYQIDAFKKTYFKRLDETGEFEVCPIINQPITNRNCNVHHCGTDFCILARKFLRTKNISFDDDLKLIRNENFTLEWKQYHHENAKLQVISAVENILIENPNATWYPVTNDTPNQSTGVKLKMPCAIKKKQKIESESESPTGSEISTESPTRKRNPWVVHCKEWAAANGVKFNVARNNEDCQEAYYTKYPERKKNK